MFSKFHQPKLYTSEGIQHFGLRKLSVGLASVALATTFLVSGPGQVKAETTDTTTNVTQTAVSSKKETVDPSSKATTAENKASAETETVAADATTKKQKAAHAEQTQAAATDTETTLKIENGGVQKDTTGDEESKSDEQTKAKATKELSDSKAVATKDKQVKVKAAGASDTNKVNIPINFVDSEGNVLDTSSVDAAKGNFFLLSNEENARNFDIPDDLYKHGWRYSTDYETNSTRTASQTFSSYNGSLSLVKPDGTTQDLYTSVTDDWANDTFKVSLVHGQKDVTQDYLKDSRISSWKHYEVVAQAPDGTETTLVDQQYGLIFGTAIKDQVTSDVIFKEEYQGVPYMFAWMNQDGSISADGVDVDNTFSMYGNTYQEWVNQIQKLIDEGKLQGTDVWGNALTSDTASSLLPSDVSHSSDTFGYLAPQHQEAGIAFGTYQYLDLMFGSKSFTLPEGYHLETTTSNGLHVNHVIDLANSTYEGAGIVVYADGGNDGSASGMNGSPFYSGSGMTMKFKTIAYKQDEYYLAPFSQEDYENYLLNDVKLNTYTGTEDYQIDNPVIGYAGAGFIPPLSQLPAVEGGKISIKAVKDTPQEPDTPTTEPVSDSKTITRTINVVDPITGETSTTKQTVTLTRTGTKDLSTGETTWGDWSTGEWPEFDAPTIDGYTPSITQVAAQTVTYDTQDVTITITYSKNKADDGDNQTDQGGSKDNGSTDQTNPVQPTGISTVPGHQGTTVKAQSQQSLPQTNGGNNLAIFGWLAAGLSALLGLAGTNRRKHE